MKRLHDLDLTRLNTFGVQACAKDAWMLESSADIAALCRALSERPPALVLGEGSNILFASDPEGPVVLVRSRGRRIVGDDGERVIVELEAGENWNAIVGWSLGEGLFGLENLTLIPGTAGAAPWQNIGAYGVEIAEFIEQVVAVDLATGELRAFDRQACQFGYRQSVFKSGGGKGWLIVSVQLALSRRPVARIGYGGLAAELDGLGDAPAAPLAVAAAVARIRRRKLPDPAKIGNAGSFFKNPIVPVALAQRLHAEHPGMPSHPVADDAGSRKIPAAWMIEACGWKGAREGAAGVADGHALVLVNHGGARGSEIRSLAMRIQASVQARFDVTLEPEPTIVG